MRSYPHLIFSCHCYADDTQLTFSCHRRYFSMPAKISLDISQISFSVIANNFTIFLICRASVMLVSFYNFSRPLRCLYSSLSLWSCSATLLLIQNAAKWLDFVFSLSMFWLFGLMHIRYNKTYACFLVYEGKNRPVTTYLKAYITPCISASHSFWSLSMAWLDLTSVCCLTIKTYIFTKHFN